ncbi:hybrid sensor histidine kinase/response regulator [Caldovatus sediminis]|uniref:histidine kinase n=1 Tax=Caldovatus sediminis TaxID=2041189 RepID=A0A8J3EBQ7_9PROT|nr:hybrid sensor histidine kinase/response regulator [Caldovatus sediminis]GGG28351.1 hybrid sensor histidine kinase/response regulator [Caldovatus sediminis]
MGEGRAQREEAPSRVGAAADTLRRLRWALIAAVAVPALLFVGAAWFDRERLLRDAADDAARAAAMLREHALKVLDTKELLLLHLDRHIQGRDWREIRALRDGLAEEMRTILASRPQLSGFGLADAEGRLWMAATRAGAETPAEDAPSIAHREFWSAQREHDAGTFISRPYAGAAGGHPTLGISRRRSTPDGTFDGTVHVGVAVSYLLDFWAQAVRGQDGAAISLVRSDGEVLARYPETGEPLPRLAPQTSALMQRLKTEPRGGVYRAASPVDGAERIAAYAGVGNYPVVIEYAVPVASVRAVWRRHLLVLGGICALAAGALGCAVLSAMRQARRLAEEQGRRAAAEATLQEGQRLELLGRLAAGVAHDFNNIVQAVQGGARLIEKSAADPERIRLLARMLDEAAGRGAALTRRMLDFSRREAAGAANDDGAADPAAAPAEAVASVCQLLSRTIGPLHRVRCEVEPEGLPALVRGDRGELEAAVMNLAVNARDAMPEGGEVVVRLAAGRVGAGGDDPAVPHPVRLRPGVYARISVTDAGTGMPPEVLARAGEPFFTTKPRGRGTGLGLSSVRGFVERVGGAMHIDSAVGRGTVVTLWLPAVGPAQVAPWRPGMGNARPEAVTLRPVS